MSISQLKLQDLSDYEVNQMLSDAWLNLNVKNSDLWNPLGEYPEGFADNPHMWITWLMTRPDYFSFICKEILGVELFPTQGMILQDLWNHRFPMLIGSRGMAKSSTLAIYALLRMLLMPGRKLIITGAAFRQSKVIFEYMENIWNNSPILRSACGGGETQGPRHDTDMWTFRIGESVTRAIPLGQGDKIRGQRAHDIIADEFASIIREIFETTIIGFAAVSSSPLNALKAAATERLAKALKIKYEKPKKDDLEKDNQIIISGTAYYDFNHFAEYHKKWHSFISSQGSLENLQQIFKSEKVPDKFNWKDYSILRIPHELVPRGFLDEAQLARAEASVHSSIFDMEYGACFSKDSAGFYRRSTIERAIASPANNIIIKECGDKPVVYGPAIYGDKKKKYVFAVDPASEVDNFAITVLELYENHRRLVYCWTTDKKDYKERVKVNLAKDGDFYGFCVRKVRNLMKVFNCEAIAIDAQGGGNEIITRLADENLMEAGDYKLLPIIDYDNPADTDGLHGLHIIHKIEFAKSDWVSSANHALKNDIENKICLFPHIDPIEVALAMQEKENSGQLYDTLEDCIFEIEELKNELCTIVMTQTPSGRDKWDTPEQKLVGSKKGRMRKDRYSSVLMANAVGRALSSVTVKPPYELHAEWTSENGIMTDGPLYMGPQNVVDVLNSLYD